MKRHHLGQYFNLFATSVVLMMQFCLSRWHTYQLILETQNNMQFRTIDMSFRDFVPKVRIDSFIKNPNSISKRHAVQNSSQVNKMTQRMHTRSMNEEINYDSIPPPTHPRSRLLSDPSKLQDLVSLGPHFLTTQSGCRIARWYYPTDNTKKRYQDCVHFSRKKRLTTKTVDKLQNYDTIYVTFTKLQGFVEELLPLISVKVVIISGQIQWVDPSVTNSSNTIPTLVDNKFVVHWFCQNLPVYGGNDLHHPKISPFPYGLKEVAHKPNLNQGLHFYTKIFLATLQGDHDHNNVSMVTKSGKQLIYAGYLRPLPNRRTIPTAESVQVSPLKFYSDLSESHYILSPNGDRPECYRHYEALGLGVVPITELDPWLFRHLHDGPVVYNNSEWNLTKLEIEMSRYQLPTVNRNMIMEEYWMEYVDWTVGAELNWWDNQQETSSKLKTLLLTL